MTKHTKTDHSAALQDALEDLADAMTFRWRELVTHAVTYPLAEGSDDFPERFESEPVTGESMWPYWAEPNTYHLGYSRKGLCAYVSWVDNGQKGDLSSVTCDGLTDANNGEKDDTGTPVPKKIDCGMGQVLQLIESWARAECAVVYDRLPKFDGHNLGDIENAHDEFLVIGRELALNKESGKSDNGTSGHDLLGTIEELAAEEGERRKWWAGWTGLAASQAKDSFFASAKPTIYNQSRILGALANLYSARAAIIEEARADGLAWIEWATKSLGETSNTKNLTPVWKTVQGIGAAVAIGGSWAGGTAAAAGGAVSLAGFLGENLIKKAKTDPEYTKDLEEVVEKLYKEVDDLNTRVTDLESEYEDAVTELQTALYGIHSFDLELYDLTENSGDGNRKSDKGFVADVSSILNIGEACFDAAEDYEALLPKLDKTTDADKHLSDKDGNPTSGDIALLEIRDQLAGFLKTTAGRYLLAGEQVKDAAESYAATDSAQADTFSSGMDSWKDHNVEYDSDLDPEKEAKDTDRGNFNPHEYGGHPLSDSKPGENAEHDYVTEETEPYEVAK